MTPSEKRPAPVDQTARPLPTLGLLPVLAVSAVMAGEAGAQTVRNAGEQDLGTILLEAGNAKGEAANSYKVTESDNDKVLAPLVDTPKTIKVITRKEIQQRGQTSVEDILRTTPGITLGTGEGGNPAGLNPIIRGNTASNDVMIDGFRSPLRTSFEAFNMESIEITKGPGGTAAGTGSTGGTINLTSKTPQEGDFNDASLSFGTGAYKRATLDMNRSFGDFGLRLNLMAQDADSLGGREGRTSRRFGIAPSLSYKIGETTKVTAGVYYFKDEDLLDYGVALSSASIDLPWRRGSGTVDDPWLPVDVPTGNYYGVTNRDFHDGVNKSGFVRLDHELAPGLTWSTALSVADFENAYVVTLPSASGSTASRPTRSSNRSGESVSLNSQLTGETVIGGMNTTFAFGIDISDTENKTMGLTVTNPGGFDPNTPIGNPDPYTPWGGTITRGPVTATTDIKTRGAYAFAVVDVAPQWEASLGLRFDDFETTAKDAAGVVTNENSSSFWNGNIGIVYKPAPNGSIYASVGSSANPGGEPNGVGGGPSSSLDALDPERAWSYELGTKWNLFDDRLFVTAALFRTEKNNARVTNAGGDLENIGKTRAQGFELDVAGQINDQWSISAGYSYIDSKIVDGGFTGGVPSTNNGTRTAGVPMHAFTLWTTYDVTDAITLGGGATFIGKRYLNGARTAMLPEQVRVDLMAAYQINESTSVQFNANNIFDEQLYAGNRGTGFVNTEPGRNFTLSLNHSF